jgi:hypothetical protein
MPVILPPAVRRSLALAALAGAVLAAPLLADSPAEALLPGDVARGDAAYVRLCLECHATPSRIVRRVQGDTAEERAIWLEEFLPDHYAPEAQDRIDLIVYMLGL